MLKCNFCLGHITKSIESMSASYSEILRINKNVVTYLQEVEESEKGINQAVVDTSVKKQTSIKEKQ